MVWLELKRSFDDRSAFGALWILRVVVEETEERRYAALEAEVGALMLREDRLELRVVGRFGEEFVGFVEQRLYTNERNEKGYSPHRWCVRTQADNAAVAAQNFFFFFSSLHLKIVC